MGCVSLPFVVCLCPTYRRPDLLENAIACFERQDYPADRRWLVVMDDSGELANVYEEGWSLWLTFRRFGSLCEKYNAMARAFSDPNATDIYMVWEDDDVYFPNHISAHVDAYVKAGAIGKPAWSKPPYVWTTHPHRFNRSPWVENAAGRFHGSISLTREMFDAVGGWPNTKAPNFDQQFMANMAAIAEPLKPQAPWSYVFRWQDTNAYHGQAFGDDWWDRIPFMTTPQPRDVIVPKLDASAEALFAVWENRK